MKTLNSDSSDRNDLYQQLKCESMKQVEKKLFLLYKGLKD